MMRFRTHHARAINSAVLLLLILGGTAWASASDDADRVLPGGYTVEQIRNMEPDGPNPYLSFLPAEAQPDYAYWQGRMKLEGEARRARLERPARLISLSETEPNDSQATANVVTGFGSDCDDSAADITGSLDAGNFDYFAIDLEAGDILGTSLVGGSRVTIFDPAEVERMGSSGDASFLYPAVSPLPGGGDSVSAYVIETAGTWAVRVEGTPGPYTLELRVFRKTGTQILFLDFDGATVDPAIFGDPPGMAVLSPLSTFLAGWGLAPADEDAVIDAIIASFTESLSEDPRIHALAGDFEASGEFGAFNILVLNSRDHGDIFGQPHVSRVIIGGTIAELGIGTIGIAQSIDVGNFDNRDDSVVLLDLLSGPSSSANSLNQFAFDASSSKVELVGTGVGNIAAHEAGHFLGNYHTEQFVTVANIMDQGGNLPGTVGVGPDATFGTADDVDVDFGPDIYVPSEGFTGIEDTLNTVAFGSAEGIFGDGFECGDTAVWTAPAP